MAFWASLLASFNLLSFIMDKQRNVFIFLEGAYDLEFHIGGDGNKMH